MASSAGLNVWPTPGALQGVKSRTKVLVKAKSGEIRVSSDRILRFSDISLNGESRILAIGAAGRAITQMVLQKQRPESGDIAHMAGLVMVHLGPHLAGTAASCGAHEEAIIDALRVKPHIVILDEALTEGSQTWIQTFDTILHSEAIRAFKGAVVVCVATEPAGPPCHGCREKWAEASEPGCLILQEEMKSKLSLVESAQRKIFPEAEASSPSKELSRQLSRKSVIVNTDNAMFRGEARELSDYCFEEDLFEAALLEGDTVTLLTETGISGVTSLCGYICYRSYHTPRAELHISRLAVRKSQRGRGLAKLLMKWIMGRAARVPTNEVEFVTLSALESAVPFYAKLGFIVAPSRKKLKEGDDPQTWMEIPNVPAVPDTHQVATNPKVEQDEVANSACDADAPTPGRGAGCVSVIKVEGWPKNLTPDEKTMRINLVGELLKRDKKKPRLSAEQRDKLLDEIKAMKGELQTRETELAKRIMDVTKQLKGNKTKPLSDEHKFELMAELESLQNALTASTSKSR